MERRNAPFKLVQLMPPVIHTPSTLLMRNKAVLVKSGRKLHVIQKAEFNVPALFAAHKPIDINCDLTCQLLVVSIVYKWNGGAKREGFAI
jgi:hypothetical protein